MREVSAISQKINYGSAVDDVRRKRGHELYGSDIRALYVVLKEWGNRI